jgi:hypothetical protein
MCTEVGFTPKPYWVILLKFLYDQLKMSWLFGTEKGNGHRKATVLQCLVSMWTVASGYASFYGIYVNLSQPGLNLFTGGNGVWTLVYMCSVSSCVLSMMTLGINCITKNKFRKSRLILEAGMGEDEYELMVDEPDTDKNCAQRLAETPTKYKVMELENTMLKACSPFAVFALVAAGSAFKYIYLMVPAVLFYGIFTSVFKSCFENPVQAFHFQHVCTEFLFFFMALVFFEMGCIYNSNGATYLEGFDAISYHSTDAYVACMQQGVVKKWTSLSDLLVMF